MLESENLVLPGEDPDVYESDDGSANREQDKIIRILTDFSVFDSRHRNEMVTLSAIEEDDGVDRKFEGAGIVLPYAINEEDEGQEDELENRPQYVRLGHILRYSVDYALEKGCVLLCIYQIY